MVVKIKPSCGAMSAALEYNENKVAHGQAEVVCRMNLDTEGDNAARETFARYERLNIRSREVSFHMSINPGPGETLTDEEAINLTKDIMDGLGYKEQPYVLYRHHDIEREHFHVLSIRVNENGKKIRSFQEQNRCQKILSTLGEKYGFVIGSPESIELSKEGINPLLFNPRSNNVSAQLDAIFEECLKYHYTSHFLFEHILEDHGIAIKLKGRKMFLQGINQNGVKCTSMMNKSEYIPSMLDRMEESMNENRARASERVANMGAALLPYSKSEEHFINMMLKKDIHVILGRGSNGSIDRAAYIDHNSRSAFYSEELGHDLSLAMLQDADGKQWQHDDSQHSSINIGELLFAPQSSSRGREKDPKYKKPKKKKRGNHL